MGHTATTTSQVAAEREESEHFRLLVQAVKDYAIFMIDPDGRVITWNAGAEAFKGYTSDEVLGKNFSMFYSAKDRKEGSPERDLRRADQAGRLESEGWRVRKNGTRFWANAILTAMRDPTGTLIGFAKVTRDLTVQRKAHRLQEMETQRRDRTIAEENRVAKEINRVKSEFLANMSHELRTPLNAIIGFAQLMFDGKAGAVSNDHKEYLGDILSSSDHLLKVINDVLDLAKVESGKMEFHPTAVDLGELVFNVCDVLRGLASEKRIRIETKVDASIAAVVLDAARLKQVLYNYLSNALKCTPEEGRVTVRAIPHEADGICIEVEDTGIGIRPEDILRLFVEFQQLDAGMATKCSGTGLGLALTKRIVEAQGGRVGVKSDLGHGSTFWAVLPRKASGLAVVSTAPLPAFPPLTTTGRTSLLDDGSSPRSTERRGCTVEMVLVMDDDTTHMNQARVLHRGSSRGAP